MSRFHLKNGLMDHKFGNLHNNQYIYIYIVFYIIIIGVEHFVRYIIIFYWSIKINLFLYQFFYWICISN